MLGFGERRSAWIWHTPGPAVSLGDAATDLAAGHRHSCAVLVGGALRCWGSGTYGSLGLGPSGNIGDNELPSAVAAVSVGGAVAGVSAGQYRTCAVLTSSALRCFGESGGALGLPTYVDLGNDIGDDELPSAVAAVSVGGLGAWQWSQSKIDAALLVVSPDIAETIRTLGTAEAGWNLWFGLGASVIPLLAAGIVGLRAAPPESPTPPSP